MEKISPKILVPIVLVLGVMGILVLKAPHSPCENQLESFKTSMVGILFPKKIKTATRPARFLENQRDCKQGNSGGACSAYFDDLRRFEADYRLLVRKCRDSATDILEVTKITEKAMETFAQLAWSSYKELQPLEVLGWLGPAEMGLYCRLKQDLQEVLGDEELGELQNKVIGNLELSASTCDGCEAGQKALLKFDAHDLWKRTIFSVACGSYL